MPGLKKRSVSPTVSVMTFRIVFGWLPILKVQRRRFSLFLK